MAVEETPRIGYFESTRLARERYEALLRRRPDEPTPWEAYLAGWKAGGVYMAHTTGKLSDPEFRLAIRILAEVLAVEQGLA